MPSPPPDFTRSTFSYDERAGQYRDGATGRFVPRKRIRDDLDRVLDDLSDDAANLASQLQNGQVGLSRWHREMMGLIKDTHLVSAASYKGGWAQMTQSDYGRVGQIVRREYDFLQDLAEELSPGGRLLPDGTIKRQALDGTLSRRVQLYMQQGRPTHYAFAKADMERRGFDEERSILNAQESCSSSSRPGCIEEAARGFVPIGKLTPIGQRTCLSNDKCSMEYRNSETGETRAI